MVVIDWDGISAEDIKLMASHYVLNRASHDLKGYDHALPESVEYRAADFVHNEPLVTLPEAPESWRSGVDEPERANRKAKAFIDAMARLTPEERATLVAEYK